METNKDDRTVPGIDKQDETNGFADIVVHDHETLHEKQTKRAVEKDRAFYDNPENPGKKFNLNDQAYSQSSPQDFVETHSKFHHADEPAITKNTSPDQI
jgi:hypothetical protein